MSHWTWITAAIWMMSTSLMLYGTWLSARALALARVKEPDEGERIIPPVSVLKPLCGLDSGLGENLESFFRIDYPEFELLFSVAREEDPAAHVVRKPPGASQ